jgi:hypothetical protein
LVENPLFLQNVKPQLLSLIQTGITWDQLLLMGLDEVICAAFSPDSPDHKRRKSQLEISRKRNRIEDGASEATASKRPLFVPDEQEAVFSLSDSDGSFCERQFSFTAHYQSKAETLSKNLSNVQKNMEYLKRKIENAKKTGSVSIGDGEQSRESFTPIDTPKGANLNIPELNSSNTASPMVQDAPIIDPELESAHYQSKAETLSKNLSDVQKNMEYLKRKIEYAKKTGSVSIGDGEQSRESFTPIDTPKGANLNIPELNSSNSASPMVQDAPIIDPELENLKRKLSESQDTFASNENELKDTSQLSLILSMKLEKLNPLVNNMVEELSMVNFKITELCDKRKLIQTNLDRYRAEAEDSTLKKQNSLLKISKLKTTQEQLKNDISKLNDSVLTYDLKRGSKTDKEKVFYFADIEYFYEYEEGYLLVESDLISSTPFSRPSSGHEIRGVLNAYYSSLTLCPIEADGSICLNENCKNCHFDDVQKTEDEKLKDWICRSGDDQTKIESLLKFYSEENSIDSFLEIPSNQTFLFNLISEDVVFASTTKKDQFYSNLTHLPVFAPVLLYYQSEENDKRPRYFDPKLSLENFQKKVLEDPKNIQSWISLAVSHLPQKIDHVSIKKCSLSLSILKDALKINPLSSILLTLYLELFQYTDDRYKIRDEFENAIYKVSSLHIRFMYFQWERFEGDKTAILVEIIKSCMGKDSSQNSLGLVNAFVQILKYDEEGIVMVKKLFKIDPDDEPDQENIEETILNLMEPKHQCFLLLCSVCYILLDYIPGYLFYDHPFRYMSMAVPFLIKWEFVHRDDRVDEACDLLDFGVDFFISTKEFGLANVILRNLIAIKMHVLYQSPDVIMDLFKGLPFDKNFKLTEYTLKCKFNPKIEPSTLFFGEKSWLNCEINSDIQSTIFIGEKSFASLNIAAKLYLDRDERDSYSKLVYCGVCFLFDQVPDDVIDISTETINKMILELFDDHFSKNSPSNSFLAYSFYLTHLSKCGQENRLEGNVLKNVSEFPQQSNILLSKL